MRARNIKPGAFSNELLGQADPITQLLFLALPMLADKEGRLEDRPLRIKAQVFPYRNIDIDHHLRWLHRYGFVDRWLDNGRGIIEVVNFKKHQTPHHTEKASELPCKPLDYKDSRDSRLDNGEYPPDSLIHPFTDSLIQSSKEDITTKKVSKPGYSMEFEVFWLAYPAARRKEKPDAYKAWKQAITLATPMEITQSAILYEKSAQARNGYAPFPAKWLKNQRWTEDHTTGETNAKHHRTAPSSTGPTKTERAEAAIARGLASTVWQPPSQPGPPKAISRDDPAGLPRPQALWQGPGADGGDNGDV